MKRPIVLLMALAFAPAAMAAYKCVDEKGVTHIGDTPPAGCANVVMQEVSRSGIVLRNIDPTPSPEQLKVRLEEQERKREADKQAAEQKRKDMALLSSFSSEREFDVTRDRNVEPLVARIKNAKERIVAVEKRIQELLDEMEFYKAGKSKTAKAREAPPVLVIQLERAQAEKATLEKTIVVQEKEIEQVRAKFDTDKKRWIALKTGAVQKPAEFVTPGSESRQPPPAKGRY